MGDEFYARAGLYDLLFAGQGPHVDFYRGQADRQGGSVLELGCGTGRVLIPIAADGHPCVGLDLSDPMLAEARRKADGEGVVVEWVHDDMRAFDLGRTFDLIVIAGNSLLHLHDINSLVGCLTSVRRHLAPGGRLVLDVFNPSVRLLSDADGSRRPRPGMSFIDPDRGEVHVEVAEHYDAADQVTRGTWFLSTGAEPDFLALPLEIRSIFPQELALLLDRVGLRLVERFGDWSGSPFGAGSPIHVCVCMVE